MYKLTGLVFCLVWIGCAHPFPKPLAAAKPKSRSVPRSVPRAIHNTCTNVWAVIDLYDTYNMNGGQIKDTALFGLMSSNHTEHGMLRWYPEQHLGDTIEDANLGEELQFKDSITAMNTYNHFKRKLFLSDSVAQAAAKRVQYVQDSAFKCNHSYN